MTQRSNRTGFNIQIPFELINFVLLSRHVPKIIRIRTKRLPYNHRYINDVMRGILENLSPDSLLLGKESHPLSYVRNNNFPS